MKKVFSILLVSILLVFTGSIKAQDASEDGFLQHVGVGVHANLIQGFGLGAHVSLLPNLKARVGIGFLPFTFNLDSEFNGERIDASQNVGADEDVDGIMNKAQISFINGSLLADYYPFGGNSVFSIVGGVYIGSNKISVDGRITEDGTAENKQFKYFGIQVNPDAEGNFSGYIRQGNIVKPYLGIGLGKTIPNSRIGFRFDLGVLYLGKIKFISDNVEGANFTITSDQMKAEDVGDAALTLFKVVTSPVFPNMQFTLSYRIF